MTLVSAMLPLPKPKAKSNGNISSGRDGSRPILPANRSPKSGNGQPPYRRPAPHRNPHETHRELGQTPQRAWDLAQNEKRSVIRPAPRCPCWDLCLEPADRAQARLGLPCAHRLTTGPPRTPSRLQSRPLPPPQRPSVGPGRPTRTKTKTHPPVHQPSQMNLSCFANYKNSCFENYATQHSLALAQCCVILAAHGIRRNKGKRAFRSESRPHKRLRAGLSPPVCPNVLGCQHGQGRMFPPLLPSRPFREARQARTHGNRGGPRLRASALPVESAPLPRFVR